jgi:hypothetical protein
MKLTDVILQNPIIILEGPLSSLMIIIEIEIQRLSKEIQTMQMMKPFDIRGESTSIFLRDLDLGLHEACFSRERGWHDCCSVCERLGVGGLAGRERTIHAERLPCRVDFWGGLLAEDVFFEEGAVEANCGEIDVDIF